MNISDLEGLPEEFQKNITEILSGFEDRSKNRQQLLRMKLEEQYQKFRAKLEFEHVDEEKIKELLEKARDVIEAFFPK